MFAKLLDVAITPFDYVESNLSEILIVCGIVFFVMCAAAGIIVAVILSKKRRKK